MTFSSKRSEYDNHLVEYATCSEYITDVMPFLVLILIGDNGRFQCFGTIIDEYHVLTAKDCFNDVDVPSLLVLAGTRAPYFKHKTQAKFIHSVVKHKVGIAIIRLEKPFQFTDRIRSIKVVSMEKSSQGVTAAYSKYKPHVSAGFKLPKTGPFRGEKIPHGNMYFYRKEKSLIDTKECLKIFDKQKIKPPVMDENYHFCIEGSSNYCWTVLGGPLIMYIEKDPFLMSVAVYSQCRHLFPTTKPPDGETQNEEDKEVEYSPIFHIRLDWFRKWIEANSGI